MINRVKNFKPMLLFFVASLLFPICLISSDSIKYARFLSLKSQKVNMRTGPGIEYPIKWVYIKKNLPVEVIGGIENWKKVRDIDGEEGWIIESLLSSKLFVIVTEKALGYKYPNLQKKPIMKVDKYVIMKLEKCQEQWCYLKVGKYSAWLEKKYLWGM